MPYQAGETRKVQTHHHSHSPEGCGATGWISPQKRRGPEGPDAFLNMETVCHTPQMRRGRERSTRSSHIQEHRDAFLRRISELSVSRLWSSSSSRMFSFILLPSLVRLETSNFAVPSPLATSFPLHARFVLSFISFTAEEVANAPRLEPSLEGLLLSAANVKPQIIDAFRVQEVTSVNLMVALDSTEEGFMKTCKQAFGIDTETGDFAHKREWAKLHMVRKQARITCDTKDRVDAVKRAHGELVSLLTADWVSLLREFKKQRGKNPGQRTASPKLLRGFRGKPARRHDPSRDSVTRCEYRRRTEAEGGSPRKPQSNWDCISTQL